MTSNRTRVFNSAPISVMILSTAVLTLGASEARGDDWQWNLTPYLWATNVGAKVSISDRPTIDRDLSFGDLLKNVDMTAQVRVEAQHGKNGLMFDVFNSELSKDTQIAVPQLGGAPASLSSKVGMTILDAGGIFNPTRDQQGFSLMYGSRMFIQQAKVDAQINLGPSTMLTEHRDLNGTKVDALVGARYAQRLFGGLTALARADGSTGGTRYTWSGSAGVSYAIGSRERYAVTVGYRRMEIKLNGDNSFDAKLTLSGIASGLRMSF